jgi:hypothetical protein
MKSRILSAVLFFLVITACKGTFDIGLEHSRTNPTSVPTSVVPLATPTSIPPSPTPQPTATTAPAAVNIVMPPGTTAGVVQGTVQPGQVVTYTLEAGQSQPMILIMNSPNNDVTLGVFEPNGNMLLNPANKFTLWQGLLPQTELYTIQVIGGATTENYTLTAKVARLVNFAAGASSITLNGTTVKGYVFSYAFSCQANQTMTVALNVPSSTAYIDIFGLATGSLLSSAVKANVWTGVLPQTQDYVIEVIPNNGQVVNYSLTVSVNPTMGGTIVMYPGTTAGVVQGTAQPGQVVTYTLQAGQSQPMVLIMNSPNNDVTLGVSEPNGNVLLNPANKWTRWQGLLPRTELYTIQVIGGATTEDYTLTAKVAQLVNIAPGATSITLDGTTVKGYVFSYALSCQANQTMTVSLNVPSSTAYIDIFGLSTGSLLSSSAKANTWTGVLPQTQDYVIEVVPNNGQVVNYSLTVSVH